MGTNKRHTPPKLAQWLLRRFIRDDIQEEVIGDLDEKFLLISQSSKRQAILNYWYQALHYLRPFAMRKRKHSSNNFLLTNWLSMSWRHIKKEPSYSAIKIGGLAIGITACILISLYIVDEVSYDKHFANGDRIYRLHWINDNDGAEYKVVWSHPPLADALRNEFPEIENAGRMNIGTTNGAGSNEIRRDDRTDNTHEKGFVFFDQQLLDLLELPMIFGQRESALSSTMSMVITQRKADQYFPNEDPIGKLMIVNNDVANPFKINGVVANPPANSHLQFDFLMTMTNREFWPGEQQEWGSTGYYATYVKLHEGSNPHVVADKMKSIANKYMRGPWSDEWLKYLQFGLQPVDQIHLYSADLRGPVSKGDIRFVWLFGIVAGLILVIACINFINLSTARSANRAKEVGLRKTVGSSRKGIINQFLVESVLYSVISFAIGIVLAALLLPQFNTIADKSITFPWTQLNFIPLLLSISVFIGIIAGIYPSFYLSSFRPIDVLKGKINRGTRSSGLRSTLVVFQFTVSIVLIISTVVIYRQVDFMLNRKPGFEKDQVLLLHGANSLPGNHQVLKDQLSQIPNIQSVTVSDFIPVTGTGVKRNANAFWNDGYEKTPDSQARAQVWLVDHDYINTMGIKLIDGRNFDENLITDSSSIIINQKMAKAMGIQSDPVGKRIVNSQTWNVIGVVEDFNYESLRSDIRPLTMVLGKSPGIISLKLKGTDISTTLNAIETTWRQFSPNQPIRYSFLDDAFGRMYEDVKRVGTIFTSFAVLAIIVACLGLFALSAFMIEQRAKEISIRILFGASIQKIFGLLTVDFVKLVAISGVLSVPIAVWLAKNWLEGFQYRIDLGWHVFAVAVAGAIALALATIGYQSIKAALAKPVDRLRSE